MNVGILQLSILNETNVQWFKVVPLNASCMFLKRLREAIIIGGARCVKRHAPPSFLHGEAAQFRFQIFSNALTTAFTA
jgi:hypothetical protein